MSENMVNQVEEKEITNEDGTPVSREQYINEVCKEFKEKFMRREIEHFVIAGINTEGAGALISSGNLDLSQYILEGALQVVATTEEVEEGECDYVDCEHTNYLIN